MTKILADIGGTHVRFAILQGGVIYQPDKIRVEEYEGIIPALAAYCKKHDTAAKGEILMAVAANPDGNGIWKFGNLNKWAINPSHMTQAGWAVSLIVNDFAASARGALELTGDQRITLKPGKDQPGEARAILGPGTGLGLAYMIPLPDGGWHIHRTKGGHMLVASLTDEQHKAINLTAKLRGNNYVPVPEDAVSGRGLPYLYKAVCQMHGRASKFSGERIWEQAQEDEDAKTTMRLFHEFLGLFVHNAVVTASAWGGVYLDGGVFNRLRENGLFDLATFEKYMAIGVVPVVREMLENVPVYAVNDPYVALRGLAAAYREGKPI